MEPTVVYPARVVRTMDPACPTAEAVAVRGDRFRAVGTVEELMAYPHAVLDTRYQDRVLLPGLVEAHSHAGTGTVWQCVYVGWVDRTDPDGMFWTGCRSIEDVVQRLAAQEAELTDPHETLDAWGMDSIYFPERPLTAVDLDRVSTERPVYVAHASGHACTVNTAALRRCGVDATTAVDGVAKDEHGRPTGELHEFAATGLVSEISAGPGVLRVNEAALGAFAQNGVNTGTTTLTDLGSQVLLREGGVEFYRGTVHQGFPARLNVFHFGAGAGPMSPSLAEDAERLVRLKQDSDEWLWLGNVKLMPDGALQGLTARVMQPGYYGDQPNGIWNVTPEKFLRALETFHRAGLLIHVHCNGDQTPQLFLDTLVKVLVDHPRPDHRHTCTPSQMTTPAQYRRMAALGACANVFANHIWAWGDQHLDLTVGPDRVRRNNAAATALRCGVPISLHSDSPVTPLGLLHTVQHAVTRRIQFGHVMGEHEWITVQRALEAVTIGSAYMLKMDHAVGFIDAGKFADLAVLEEDPLAVPEHAIGDICVHGTVVGRRHCASNVPAPGEH